MFQCLMLLVLVRLLFSARAAYHRETVGRVAYITYCEGNTLV